MKKKFVNTSASLLGKDTKTFLKGGMSDLLSGIDLPTDALIPKKSEDFVQKVLKDTKGDLVVNEPVHNIMHRFMRIARRKGFNKYMILGGFGLGKCFGKGTKVLLHDCSVKNIEDIKIGDLLMGDDGTPRRVLNLGSGKEEMYKITLKNGDSFVCNESHIMSFKISNKYKTKKYSKYNKGDIVNLNFKEWLTFPEYAKKNCFKLYKSKLEFKESNTLLEPYFFGVWLGDGHSNNLEFTINNQDEEIADYLFDWAEKHKFKIRVDDQKGDCTRYGLNKGRSNCKKYIQKTFIMKISKKGKRIPKNYLINSRENRLELLAGMLDTDGYSFAKCFEWSTKYIDLRNDFLFLCRSLGFRLSHRTKYVNGVPYYVVVVSGDTHLIPCKTRKAVEERKINKNPLVFGFDVEPLGKKEFFGVVLDGNKLFLLEDFTVVHNTQQICIGYSLYRIAKNPNILIKLVHVSDTEATHRCRSIRDYIEGDEDFKSIAPHITPTNIWGSEKFIVKRDSPAANCTVESHSVLGTGIGGRANLIIFDDPQDLRTAVYEPTTRVKIEDTIKSVWITRLIPDDSEAIILINKWHDSDIASYVQRNPAWAWISIAADEKTMEHLIVKDSFGRNFKIPLWSKFNKAALEDRKITLGERDFKRGYCLIPYSDSDKTFGHFEKCCHFSVSPRAVIEFESNWIFVGGIDFAGSKRPGTVLSIVAVHRKTGLKLPIEIVTIRKSSDLTGHIIRTYREYGVELYFAENNGVQEAIIDLLKAAMGDEKFKKYNIKIDGFLTGRGKMDINTGLPSMDKEFENKEWMFCFNEKPDIADDMEQKPWSRMYYEMLNHPFHETSDIAMSLYFCREAAKKLIRGIDSGPNCF